MKGKLYGVMLLVVALVFGCEDGVNYNEMPEYFIHLPETELRIAGSPANFSNTYLRKEFERGRLMFGGYADLPSGDVIWTIGHQDSCGKIYIDYCAAGHEMQEQLYAVDSETFGDPHGINSCSSGADASKP